jgi:hypothetical protein
MRLAKVILCVFSILGVYAEASYSLKSAALPPDVRKAYGFPFYEMIELRRTGPERQSLSAHQTAKPRTLKHRR